jgi:hypothetical protein
VIKIGGEEINENEMGGKCNAQREDKQRVQHFGWKAWSE